MSDRRRPLKLHVKDGKESRFLLIGPKGREIQDLVWDGSALALEAVSASDEVSGPSEGKEVTEKDKTISKYSEDPIDDATPDVIPGPAQQKHDSTATEPIPANMDKSPTKEADIAIKMVTGDAEVDKADALVQATEDDLPDLPTPSDEPGQPDAVDTTDVPTSDAFDLDKKKDKGLVHDSDNPDPSKKPVAYIDESTDDKIVITRVVPKGDGDDLEPDDKAKERVLADAKKRTPDAKLIDKGQATKLLGHDPDVKGKGDKVEVDKPKDDEKSNDDDKSDKSEKDQE